MGGIRVDPDTAGATVRAYAAGEARRGSRREPSWRQLAVGPPCLRRRAGQAAAEYSKRAARAEIEGRR